MKLQCFGFFNVNYENFTLKRSLHLSAAYLHTQQNASIAHTLSQPRGHLIQCQSDCRDVGLLHDEHAAGSAVPVQGVVVQCDAVHHDLPSSHWLNLNGTSGAY